VSVSGANKHLVAVAQTKYRDWPGSVLI
jgi:hypothetical protein